MENLLAARELLRTSLQKSDSIAVALEKTGPKIEEINRRFQSLGKCSLIAIEGKIDCVLAPAAAIRKVFRSLCCLEKSLLSDPSSDLFSYLSAVKRLEEGLGFLEKTCGLAVQWMEDAKYIIEKELIPRVDDDRLLLNVENLSKVLRTIQTHAGSARADGGFLSQAFCKLELEFVRILNEISVPFSIHDVSSSFSDRETPSPSIHKLRSIIGRLNASNRLEKCVSLYIQVRSSNARASLRALGLDYLDISISEFDNTEHIEGYVGRWGKHLEFAVKHLFAAEYELCNNIFKETDSDVSMLCFAEIAARSGLYAFFRFGNTVTASKRDPIKLLRVLETFSALSKVRYDFNRLFGGKAFTEIQTLTRDLIKRIVEGACDIFGEISVQVELQHQVPPPPDGGVARLVIFITEYCSWLNREEYRPILTEVIRIHQSWNHEKFSEEENFLKEICKILLATESNLGKWAMAYEDAALSCLFMMNNNFHLYKNLKGTGLGDIMGTSWLREREKCVEYYASAYLRVSWGKLSALLIGKSLKGFSDEFDDLYKKQASWAVPDKCLMEQLRQHLVQTIVPVYRSYLHSSAPSVERQAKYSAESMENMLSSLFQPKLGKYGGI